MNENIDLRKILKNCPKGTILYSLIHGYVEFSQILDKGSRVIEVISITSSGNRFIEYYTFRGQLHSVYNNDECVLFPSRTQRDWSKFTAPWYKKEKFDPKTLNPFDKVLVKCASIYNSNLVWRVGLFSYFHVEDDSIRVYTLGSDDNSPKSYVIPYNADTKHLVNTEIEAPEYYRYWED